MPLRRRWYDTTSEGVMFEAVEVGNKIDKEIYAQELPVLREALLEAQKRAGTSDFAVAILLHGGEASGRGEVLHRLLEWLDARGVQVHAFGKPSPDERGRPPLWRFWMALPPRGRLAIFYGSWYTKPIEAAFRGRLGNPQLDQELDRFVELERMLVREDVLVVKLWLHLSRAAMRKRLKKWAADPATAWRISRRDRKYLKRYDRYRPTLEHALRRTDTAEAPWHLIEAADRRYRDLTVARTLLSALRTRLDRPPALASPKPELPRPAPVNVLNRLDLTRQLSQVEYDEQLPTLQAQVGELTRRLHERDRSMIVLFEGPDAAGKGGAIRRLTWAMDPRDYQVISIAAPTEEERAHPYLWRFWRNLPQRGKVTVYDRSWYGRVLVERIEGFCRPEDWQRAHGEINAFEEQLVDYGILLVKFWLATSPDEQLRRFQERQTTPFKQYKLTEEDWRNRAKWDAYEAAACDMIERTSTEVAPWVLVEAENKEWGRVKVVRTVVDRLKTEV
jgi:polyphosphate:AMP phosphotransferase